MVRLEQWMDIKELQQQGLSIREIARRTGHSRNTITKILGQKAPASFNPSKRPSCLDPYKAYLTQRFEAYGLRAPRLLEELRAQGYAGSINLVQRFLKSLKDQQASHARATLRFETAPGDQAQADWAHVGRDAQGKIYAFVIVLGFSRLLFVTFTRSMDLPTLIRCHQEAFDYFGGMPARILYDNRAQVKQPSGGLHPLFADFAAHYGFTATTHRPYRPRTKGKVERMVDYLKDHGLRGRSFASFEDLCQHGRAWIEQANQRVHAATGERPIDLLPREGLTPVSAVPPYALSTRHDRRVDAEGYVQVANTRYSVPPDSVGKRVVVVLGEQTVCVRLGNHCLVEHPRGAPGACVTAPEHVQAMWRQTLKQSRPPRPALTWTACEAVAVPALSHYEEASA